METVLESGAHLELAPVFLAAAIVLAFAAALGLATSSYPTTPPPAREPPAPLPTIEACRCGRRSASSRSRETSANTSGC